MKKKILEYLIRECVREVLKEVDVATEPSTIGAPAPPEANQGTADQPAIQQNPIYTVNPRGIWFIDPKNPQKPMQLNLKYENPAKLEKDLYRIASKSGGPRVKISGKSLRDVPGAISDPNRVLFLYIGKLDPEDPEGDLNLLSTPLYDVAKRESVKPGETAEHPTTTISKDPYDPEGIAQQKTQQQAGGKVLTPDTDDSNVYNNEPAPRALAPEIDECVRLKTMLRNMIKEAIENVKK